MITRALLFLLLCGSFAPVQAQDVQRLGGDLSINLGGYALQAAAPNISDYYIIVEHVGGFGRFHGPFNRSSGLGPAFINESCGGCHVANGKGPLHLSRNGSNQSTAVVKVSTGSIDELGNPVPVPGVGQQVQDRVLSGKRTFKMRLRWRKQRGTFSDGEEFELRAPKVRIRKGPKSLSSSFVTSLRIAPMIIGLGLLEAIPEDTILALSDPEDSDNDGISGRPNYVPDLKYYGVSIGRFGYKASQPSIEQQTAAAALFDVGVTSSLFSESESTQELSDEMLYKLVLYQSSASVPFARSQDSESIIEGKRFFQIANCNSCHTMSLKTGEHYLYYLENQTIHPFTDLLLHDMGPGLADDRPEFSASGSEWRTTPLWGIGLAPSLAVNHKPRYLHDGRARTLQEAILWHGGEAQQSKEAYMNLTKEQRSAVLEFLRSL